MWNIFVFIVCLMKIGWTVAGGKKNRAAPSFTGEAMTHSVPSEEKFPFRLEFIIGFNISPPNQMKKKKCILLYFNIQTAFIHRIWWLI